MLKTGIGKQGERKMAKRINWELGNTKRKVYLHSGSSETPGWRTIKNTSSNQKCQSCNRLIKINQKFLWHIETKAKMHLPEDCKLW